MRGAKSFGRSVGRSVVRSFCLSGPFGVSFGLHGHFRSTLSLIGLIWPLAQFSIDSFFDWLRINLHLQTHLIHVSNILNNAVRQEDLDDAKTTIEQVNCSLTNWKTKFDIVCNLAQSSGVDLETLNNIRNEHDSLTLYNKALTSNVNYITTFTNIKKESESGY